MAPLKLLSVFSEVWESESFRWLILVFVPQAYSYKHKDCNEIRKHLVNLLHGMYSPPKRIDSQMDQFGRHIENITSAMASHPLSPNASLDHTPLA